MIPVSLCAGFLLDLLFGDPAWLPHPVVRMGRCITWFENRIRPLFPETPAGERLAGRLLAACLPLLTLFLTAAACFFAYRIHPYLGAALEAFWCAQSLAVRGLRQESMRVCDALTENNLAEARTAVARIVGRDTEALSGEAVAKAAVETVAENFSDGVAAPLLYMALGGAPLALCYKAVNTMDSMVGYRNETYLHFGRAAAKLDDMANYLPSRIAALCFIAAAALTGYDARGAFRIWKRDANKHASPNAGQTESACAGALGIRLGGDAVYFGQIHRKEVLGDAKRACEPADIRRANRMMYAASMLLFGTCLTLRLLWMAAVFF